MLTPVVLSTLPPSPAILPPPSTGSADADWLAAWAAVASFVATIAIAVVLSKSGLQQRRADETRSRRQAMTDAHIRLTTGEVAAARHLSGVFSHMHPLIRFSRARRRRTELIRAFYTLVWTIESVANLRKTWTNGEHDGRRSDFLKWNEDALHSDVDDLRRILIGVDRRFEQQSQDAWNSVLESRRH